LLGFNASMSKVFQLVFLLLLLIRLLIR